MLYTSIAVTLECICHPFIFPLAVQSLQLFSTNSKLELASCLLSRNGCCVKPAVPSVHLPFNHQLMT